VQKRIDRNRGGDTGPEMGMGGDMGRFSLGRQTFSSFRNPVFLLYYGAMLGQMAAMNMQMFARGWLI